MTLITRMILAQIFLSGILYMDAFFPNSDSLDDDIPVLATRGIRDLVNHKRHTAMEAKAHKNIQDNAIEMIPVDVCRERTAQELPTASRKASE